MASKEVKEVPAEIKRFGLNLPSVFYDEIEKYAQINQITVTEAMKHLLKIGLFIENTTVYQKLESGSYREIMFI